MCIEVPLQLGTAKKEKEKKKKERKKKTKGVVGCPPTASIEVGVRGWIQHAPSASVQWLEWAVG
jgi:hypothetical protein